MAPDKTLTAFALPKAQLEQLREVARAERTSVSAIIRQAVQAQLAKGAPVI
jgi:hypothetical protein